MLRVLGISGSTGANSRSARIVEFVLRELESLGATTELLYLHEHELPIFRPYAPVSPLVEELRQRSQEAQAFVISTPEYHGGMTGMLKNFFDYHYKEFEGKLFGLGVATSRGLGSLVIQQLITVIHHCHGWTLPYSVAVTEEDFEGDGSFREPVRGRLHQMARDLWHYGRILFAARRSQAL